MAELHLPERARLIVPSVTDLVFVVLLISLAWGPLTRRLLGDGGIGWHIRTGQIILRSHAIPRSDPFSISTAGKPWYAWEWLYDAAIAGIYNHAGLNGVVFLTAVLISLTFALVFRMMVKRGASVPVALVLLLLAMSASTIHFFARPHVLSWLFTICWFGILDSTERTGETRPLWLLPATALVWVNVHGGFLVGFILLGTFLISAVREALLSYATDADSRRLGVLAQVTALSVVATFVNPYGYRLHLHIYQYLGNRFLMDHIDEFLSPNFHGIAQKCFAVLLLLTLVALASARRKVRLSEALVVVFAAYSGLYASRNLPVSSMLLVLVIGPMISGALRGGAENGRVAGWLRMALSREQRFAERTSALEFSLRGHAWAVLVVGVGLWICLHNGRPGSTLAMEAGFDSARFPVHAVDALATQRVREPIFCTDAWGGYLIFRGYPVVMDDRHDLYGEEFLKKYLNIVRIEPGWDSALASMRADWVVVPAEGALANVLRETPAWRVVYSDKTAALFRRADNDVKSAKSWLDMPSSTQGAQSVPTLKPRKASTATGWSPSMAGLNFQ